MKMFSGNVASCTRMSFIIGVDTVHGRQNVFHRRESKQAAASRQDIAKAGLLRNDGAARREIGSAAVAEPSRAEADILVFGDSELAAGMRDVLLILIDVRREWRRLTDAPAVVGKH